MAAVHFVVDGSNERHGFVRFGSPTLAVPASYWKHSGPTIDVLLSDGSFAAAPLTTHLTEVLAEHSGVKGDGSEDSPICIRVVSAGANPGSSVAGATGAAAATEFVTGALWNKTKLWSLWITQGVFYQQVDTWNAEPVFDLGKKFMQFWQAHAEELKGLELTTRLCGPEPDAQCYECAHALLTDIYKCMVVSCLGKDASWGVSRLIFKAINKRCTQAHGSGAPDMAWGLLLPQTVLAGKGLDWTDHGKIIHELKADVNSLDDGTVQVVDRGNNTRQQHKGQRSILLGASSTGVVLRSLVVVHNADGSLQALYQSDLLELAAPTSGSGSSRDVLVDTSSSAYKELVWQVYYAAGQHLCASAELPDELLPGDVITVSVAADGGGRSGSITAASFCVSWRIGRGVCRAGAAYAAVALDGPSCQQQVVLKIGPSPADRKLAVHLRLSWPPWYQVERELAVRGASVDAGFQHMPPLVAGGTVVQCRRGGEAVAPRLAGAPVVATLLLGKALVEDDGVLPVLPAHEVATLLECLTTTVHELQAHGVHHNDITPDNIGVLRSPTGALQACYLYDLGAAAGRPVVEIFRQEARHVRMEALLSATKSLVWDLEYGSRAAVWGGHLQPSSDLESLLFCCIRLLGHMLPWSVAAAAGNKEEVMRLREAAAQDPSSLPGFASYPPELQAFAFKQLSESAPVAACRPGPGHGAQGTVKQLVRTDDD